MSIVDKIAKHSKNELEERVRLMYALHTSYVEVAREFGRIRYDPAFIEEWKDVFDNLMHEGNRCAGNLKYWAGKGDPDSGWNAVTHTFAHLRTMSLIISLVNKEEQHGHLESN